MNKILPGDLVRDDVRDAVTKRVLRVDGDVLHTDGGDLSLAKAVLVKRGNAHSVPLLLKSVALVSDTQSGRFSNVLEKGNEDQPRDNNGKWTAGSTGDKLKSSGWKEKVHTGYSTFTHSNHSGHEYSVAHRTGRWNFSSKNGEKDATGVSRSSLEMHREKMLGKAYNEDQPRDENGRWSGGSAMTNKEKAAALREKANTMTAQGYANSDIRAVQEQAAALESKDAAEHDRQSGHGEGPKGLLSRDSKVEAVQSALKVTHGHLNDGMLNVMANSVVSKHESGDHGGLRHELHSTYGLTSSSSREAIYSALKGK